MREQLMRILKEKAKEGKVLNDSEKAAKMDVLGEMEELMENQIGGVIGDNMKKVTVASDSKEGLEAGLEKAKEVIEKKQIADDAECEMCDEEGYEQELSEPAESTDDKIARLKAELAELEA